MTEESPAEAIFFAALERTTSAQRADFLDHACAGDTGLRRRVERLLTAHVQAGDFLERPIREAADLAALASPGPDGNLPQERSGEDDAPGDQPAEPETLDFLTPSQKPESRGRLGHYEVLEVVGKGAMGVVLRAFDEKLHRVVAIKVLAPQLATSATARLRFIREGRAAAAVAHDNIIAIHAVEESGPIPYLVMQFIDGSTLQGKLDKAGPLPVREVLRIGMQIAAGLAAAHAQGLVHRDIKPANILLENSVERVKITDFGLARAVDDASLTQSGIIAGTPAYVSPEQADGTRIDARSDLFSLGSVLYTLCVGHAPFRADTTMAVLKRVCEKTPRPLREINAEIPDWLDGIIARLHAKDPTKRFQTAAEVAELLGRHLAAVQLGQVYREKKSGRSLWLRRMASFFSRGKHAQRRAAVAGSLLVVVLGGSLAAVRFAEPSADSSASSTAKGAAALVPSEQKKQPLRALLVAGSPTMPPLRLPSPLDALERQSAALPDDAPPELLTVLGDAPRFTMPVDQTVHWMAQTRDGQLLAVPSGNNIRLFDTRTGALVRVFTGHTNVAYRPAFSPDDKRLASGSGNAIVRVWDVATGNEELTLTGHQNRMWCVAWDLEGKRLVSADVAGAIKVWDAGGKLLKNIAGPTGGVHGMAFSPDGKRLATASLGGNFQVWDTATWNELRALKPAGKPLRSAAWSNDGKLLAAGWDDEVTIWNADNYEVLHTVSPAASGGVVHFAPDGRTLLTARFNFSRGERDSVVRWDVRTGARQGSWELTAGTGFSFLHVSPDGQTVYVARHGEARVKAYDAQTGQERFSLRGHSATVQSLAFSPDGRLLASGSQDHTIRLWELSRWKAGEPQPPSRVISGHLDHVWSLAFSPDGSRLASSGSRDGLLILWDTATGNKINSLAGPSRKWPLVAFSPDGATVAAGSEDGAVNFWDARTGRRQEPLYFGDRMVRAVAFSPDGRVLAAGDDRNVVLFDCKTCQRLYTFPRETLCTNLVFSQDSKTLLATGDVPDARLRSWDVASGQERQAGEGHTRHILGLALQPGGRLAATGSWDGSVRLWDVKAPDKEVRNLTFSGSGQINQVAFSPDGHYLAAALQNYTIVLLRLAEPISR
jgi:WD40 repeat protein/serine/threonine protein kinase